MNQNSSRPPPRIATALLLSAVPSLERDQVLADMAELFALQLQRRGVVYAWAWYWWQAFAFLFGLRFTRAGQDARLLSPDSPGRPATRDHVFLSVTQELRFAWRSLRRSPAFSLVVVVTLALGIGANTAMFSLVNATLLGSLPYPDAGKTFMVWETFSQWSRLAPSPANFIDWRERNTSFEEIAAYSHQGFNLSEGESPERVQGAQVTANFLRVFGLTPILGRGFVAADDMAGAAPVVVISDGLWRRRFGGDPSVVGQTVRIDAIPHTLIGVMPPEFRIFHPGLEDVWIPGLTSSPAAADTATSFRWHWLRGVARLRGDVSSDQARLEMNEIAAQLGDEHPRTNEGWGVNLVPMREQVVGDTRTAVLLLFGAVGFVLLIGCANVSNLMLARATARRTEMSLRLALGATRARAIQFHIAEAVVLGVIGGALGLALAHLGTDVILAMSPRDFPLVNELRIDARVLGFTLLISLIAGGLTSVLPALRVPDGKLGYTLRERRQGGMRRALVTIESALIVVLLVGAGLMIGSLSALMGTDPGFDTEGRLTFEMTLPDSKYPTQAEADQVFKDVTTQIGVIPGVTAVGVTTSLPIADMGTSFGTHVEGRSERPQGAPPTQVHGITTGFLEALGIALLRGRRVRAADDATAPSVVVINEALATLYFPDEDPLGRRITPQDSVMGPWFTVVGVVSDVQHTGLGASVAPTMYLPVGQLIYNALQGYVLVRTDASDPLAIVPQLRAAVHRVDAEQPIANLRTFDDVVTGSLAGTRFQALLLTLFAATGLILGAVGVYGVVGYTVNQQLREIGLRIALGASSRDVTTLFLRIGIGPVALGLMIGIVAALGLAHLMSSVVVGISTTDPTTFAAVSMVLLGVAAVAAYVPARRASLVDPVKALRSE